MTPDADPFLTHGTPVSAPSGACLFRPGDAAQAFLIVRSGVVRVEQTNTQGRTVVLYRVRAGDSCVLTTTCLLSDRDYSGYGYAEGPVEAVAIPADRFRRLLADDATFRELVFHAFADRVSELTGVIDDLLLHRTDLRLARWLADTAPGEPVHMTQQDIAQEIGTAREVVSRALKAFERNGWVRIGRGEVEVLDAPALRAHARSEV